jgi:hypothetical protein
MKELYLYHFTRSNTYLIEAETTKGEWKAYYHGCTEKMLDIVLEYFRMENYLFHDTIKL